MATLVGQIRSLEASIKQLEKGIEQIVKALPEYQCLTSIPGVGPAYAAGLIAEIGQIQRFENQAKLAKYAGLHLKKVNLVIINLKTHHLRNGEIGIFAIT